ncbi:MAG: substrate-binding domain-containing protein, partial [Kiritimatiellae bacterium]|nr:substrate-binding domain-containing protein [Kiritimatiellia bacterium]
MAATVLYLRVSDTPVQRMKFAGVRRYAASREWKVIAVKKDDSGSEQIRELFKRHRPVGCVVDCCGNESPLRPSIFGDLPAVWLDAPSHARGVIGSHSVSVDEEAVASTALRELTANFPKSLAAVEFQFEPYQRRQRWSRDRSQAFCELAKGTGLPCAVFETHERESPETRAARLAGWLSKLPRPCGVFAVNDGTAWQVRAACRAARLSIPRDIAVVGVDNDPELCEDGSPALSSIQIDFERMGYVAARMLLENVLGKGNLSGEAALNGVDGSGKAVSISPMLVVRRRSTGGRGRQESLILKAVE